MALFDLFATRVPVIGQIQANEAVAPRLLQTLYDLLWIPLFHLVPLEKVERTFTVLKITTIRKYFQRGDATSDAL